jgi:hypothetical protein
MSLPPGVPIPCPSLDPTPLHRPLYFTEYPDPRLLELAVVQGPDDPTRARRLDWARLMARTHPFDVRICQTCGGPMRVVAFIEHPAVARKILEHLGLPSRAPPRGRGLGPGQQVTLFGPRGGDPRPDDPLDGIDPPSTY